MARFLAIKKPILMSIFFLSKLLRSKKTLSSLIVTINTNMGGNARVHSLSLRHIHTLDENDPPFPISHLPFLFSLHLTKEKETQNRITPWKYSFIPSPRFLSQLSVFSGHPPLCTPSRLHGLQDLSLDLLLLWTSLTYHGNKHRRAVEPFCQFPSAPGHGIAKSESADFLNVRRFQMVLLLGSGFGSRRKFLRVRGNICTERSSNIVGGKKLCRRVIHGGCA